MMLIDIINNISVRIVKTITNRLHDEVVYLKCIPEQIMGFPKEDIIKVLD